MSPLRIWTIVGLFTLAYWGTGTDPQYPLLLVEFIGRRFGVENFAASMPIIAFSLGACLGTIGAGLLAPRFGIGSLIFIALWGFFTCSVINTGETPLWLFDLIRFFTGVFQGMLALLFLLAIGVLVEEEHRGTAVGVLSAGAMMAVVAVPMMVIATRPPGDLWRLPFLAFGGAAGISVIGLHLLRMPLRPQHEGVPVSPWPLLREPRMQAYLVLGGLLLASVVAMGAQFPVFCKDRFGLEVHQLIPQMLTLGAGAVTGAVLAGPATDRWGSRPVLIWASVAVMVFFAFVPVLTLRPWTMYPVFFVMSALAAARVPPYQALMLNVIPESARGPILGIRNVISYLGTATGAAGGALCYQYLGGYQAVALFAAAVSALILWMIAETVPHEALEMKPVTE